MLENELYQRLLKSEAENKKLKLKIEEYKKQYEYNRHFHKEHFRYKQCFEPLVSAYNELLLYLQTTKPIIDKLIKLYDRKLLLNPNIQKVKLQDNDKNMLLGETRQILRNYKKQIQPKLIKPEKLTSDFEENKKAKKKLRTFVNKKTNK